MLLLVLLVMLLLDGERHLAWDAVHDTHTPLLLLSSRSRLLWSSSSHTDLLLVPLLSSSCRPLRPLALRPPTSRMRPKLSWNRHQPLLLLGRPDHSYSYSSPDDAGPHREWPTTTRRHPNTKPDRVDVHPHVRAVPQHPTTTRLSRLLLLLLLRVMRLRLRLPWTSTTADLTWSTTQRHRLLHPLRETRSHPAQVREVHTRDADAADAAHPSTRETSSYTAAAASRPRPWLARLHLVPHLSHLRPSLLLLLWLLLLARMLLRVLLVVLLRPSWLLLVLLLVLLLHPHLHLPRRHLHGPAHHVPHVRVHARRRHSTRTCTGGVPSGWETTHGRRSVRVGVLLVCVWVLRVVRVRMRVRPRRWMPMPMPREHPHRLASWSSRVLLLRPSTLSTWPRTMLRLPRMLRLWIVLLRSWTWGADHPASDADAHTCHGVQPSDAAHACVHASYERVEAADDGTDIHGYGFNPRPPSRLFV